jgi:putative DNA base modification enzyme with NMAD domain
VFVFYGWFRQVELVLGKYRYISTAPDLHVIFGWLQIEQRLPVDSSEVPLWARDHPHCKTIKYYQLDSIYLSTRHLQVPGAERNTPGAGKFRRFTPELCLTAPQQSRSIWQLPAWFYPRASSSSLSYHSDLSRWKLNGNTVLLHSVGRGQEFVLDCEVYPEAIEWLCELLHLYYTVEQTQTLLPDEVRDSKFSRRV